MKLTQICVVTFTFAISLCLISIAADKSAVHHAQVILTELGYDPGPIDGIIGRKMQYAIKAFQKREGLHETGALDDETITALSIAAENSEKVSFENEGVDGSIVTSATTNKPRITISKNAPHTIFIDKSSTKVSREQWMDMAEYYINPRAYIARRMSTYANKNERSYPIIDAIYIPYDISKLGIFREVYTLLDDNDPTIMACYKDVNSEGRRLNCATSNYKRRTYDIDMATAIDERQLDIPLSFLNQIWSKLHELSIEGKTGAEAGIVYVLSNPSPLYFKYFDASIQRAQRELINELGETWVGSKFIYINPYPNDLFKEKDNSPTALASDMSFNSKRLIYTMARDPHVVYSHIDGIVKGIDDTTKGFNVCIESKISHDTHCINSLAVQYLKQGSEIHKHQIIGLNSKGNKDAIDNVSINLNHTDIVVQKKAVLSLAEIGSEDALDSIKSVLFNRTSEYDLHIFIANVLANINSVAFRAVIRRHIQDLLKDMDHNATLFKCATESDIAEQIPEISRNIVKIYINRFYHENIIRAGNAYKVFQENVDDGLIGDEDKMRILNFVLNTILCINISPLTYSMDSLEEIRIDYKQIYKRYYQHYMHGPGVINPSQDVRGESITFTMRFSRTTDIYSYTFETEWPKAVSKSTRYIPANLMIGDIFIKIIDINRKRAGIGKTSEGISSVPAFRKYPIASDKGHYVNLESKYLISKVILQQLG